MKVKIKELFYNDSIRKLEIFILYVFSFVSMLSVAISTLSIWILTFLLLLNKNRWRFFYKNMLFWIFILSFIYLILSYIHGVNLFPEYKDLQFKEFTRWIRLWLFLSIGFAIYGDENIALNVLKFAFLGFLISIFIYIIKDPTVFIHIPRVGLGHKTIVGNLFISTAVLGLIIFAPRILKNKNPWKYIIFFIIFLILCDALFIPRSRGVWLATAIVFPIVLFFCYFRQKRYIKWSIGIILLICLVITWNFKFIKSRIMASFPTFKIILKMKESEIPPDSIGVRYFLFKLGVLKTIEKPFFGWGVGANIPIIKNSKNKKLQVKQGEKILWFDHLHNFYLEILLRFGVIGFLLFSGTVGIITLRFYKKYKSGLISEDIFIFSMGVLGLIAVYSLSDFRHLHPDFRFYWAIIGGVIYGLGSFSKNIPYEPKK